MLKSTHCHAWVFVSVLLVVGVCAEQQPTASKTQDVPLFETRIDPSVEYSGPKATFASITGSPIWGGYNVDGVIGAAKQRGWKLQSSRRLPTPYGESPLVNHFVTPGGRSVMWIPSYGWEQGQDDRLHWAQEKLFWVLWKAGVKVLVIGGNSGSADWRQGDEAIRTGDLVLPWSFRTQSWYRGLPGTMFESVWQNPQLKPGQFPFMGEPFSMNLAKLFVERAKKYQKDGVFRRIHTPAEARAVLVHPDSITFETNFDILMWQNIARSISEREPEKPPVVTLHGDCINPILARLLQIDVLYYHIVSNVAQGLPMTSSLQSDLKKVISRDYARVVLELEFDFLQTAQEP
jgi:hypothetical protein